MSNVANIHRLITETGNTGIAALEELSTSDLLLWINQHDQHVALRVLDQIPIITRVVDKVSANMAAGGRLIYVGAGTSGRLGILDAAECPPTFGVDYETVIGIIAGGERAIRRAAEDAEDNEQQGYDDLLALDLRPKDSVVGISASGRTPYVLGALRAAQSHHALAIALSNNPGSEIGRMSSLVIEVDTGPEILAGSTRMKAGTAQKMVLNMISTAVMVRLGKTYQNLMVDMIPSNEKLADRAKRIVATACDCSYEEAAHLFEQAHGNVKVAILMGHGVPDANEAQQLLHDNSGSVHKALNNL